MDFIVYVYRLRMGFLYMFSIFCMCCLMHSGIFKLGGLINHFVDIGLINDVLHCKSLACVCLHLQNDGRHVFVHLNSVSGVTIDHSVHEIHHAYVLFVKDRHCVVNSLGIYWIVVFACDVCMCGRV